MTHDKHSAREIANLIESSFVNPRTGTQKKMARWLNSQSLLNARVIKYGVVGCAGIFVNLGTMALLFTISSQRGGTSSAVANIVSTVGNFVFHNLWTFSDRQHGGLRLVRGFLSFALMSAAGICVTTTAYVGFTRIAANMTITNSHLSGLGIVLTCQFVAILSGASVSYALNRKFTWPRTQESAPADTAQLQEI
jgi:putative flippase GtrA